MSEAEFLKWLVFHEQEPWGSEVEFYRTGIIAAMIANTASTRKKNSTGMSPGDFVPKQSREPSGMDPKHVRSSLFATFGDRMKPANGK